MDKKAKERMFDRISNDEHIFLEGCKIEDKQCLINAVISRIDTQTVASLKNLLFDSSIVSVLKDEELMRSVNEFFNNNLNISETSRNAFLHRNTLIYRIEKIKNMTGFNVKNFNDAVSFKILELLYLAMEKNRD